MQDYRKTWASMQNVILSKGQSDPDEIWLLEHFPVYTLGLGASENHLLIKNDIPVIRSDRGGEVTFHGPGQIVAYFLINLRRKGWGPKKLVNELESSVIDFLKIYGISRNFLFTTPRQFELFCKSACIPCEPVPKNDYFNSQQVDDAYYSGPHKCRTMGF